MADWKTKQWPRLKKKPAGSAAPRVFLDESGLSQRPHRTRTWAPRGRTPVLTFNFNWKSVSAIAGVALRNFYFQLHAGAIKSAQVIGFLRLLHRHVPGKVLLLWDGAPIHRSRVTAAFVQSQSKWLHVARLPAYASRTQSRRVSLGLLEEKRTRQLLPQRCLATQPRRQPGTQAHPPPQTPAAAHRRLLPPSGIVLNRVSLL
ncbi:MAG: transposase [Lacunisphaera sp.]